MEVLVEGAPVGGLDVGDGVDEVERGRGVVEDVGARRFTGLGLLMLAAAAGGKGLMFHEVAGADAGGEGLGGDAQEAGGVGAGDAGRGQVERGAEAGDFVGVQHHGPDGVVVGESAVVGAQHKGERAEGAVAGGAVEKSVQAAGDFGPARGGFEAREDMVLPSVEQSGVEGVHVGASGRGEQRRGWGPICPCEAGVRAGGRGLAQIRRGR